MISSAAPRSSPSAAIRPPRMPTSQANVSLAVATRPPRMMVSSFASTSAAAVGRVAPGARPAAARGSAPRARRWRSGSARRRETAARRLPRPGGEIGADVEGELVAADAQRCAGQQGLVGAPVGVGDRLLQQPLGAGAAAPAARRTRRRPACRTPCRARGSRAGRRSWACRAHRPHRPAAAARCGRSPPAPPPAPPPGCCPAGARTGRGSSRACAGARR